ncbi:Ankyrin repeat, PH and SEC7 domain containing protein secG [Fusarium oxysporum f. sp. albedinis]|nr:Ankyrin repeat, PH and SEC7 domain containing protein secG [Fusarium oxysporum f. sp. albedinis]
MVRDSDEVSRSGWNVAPISTKVSYGFLLCEGFVVSPKPFIHWFYPGLRAALYGTRLVDHRVGNMLADIFVVSQSLNADW